MHWLCESLVEVLLGKFVVGGSFLASNEASQTEFFACSLASLDPSSQTRLLESLGALYARLFRHNLSSFVDHKILLDETTLSLISGTAPYASHGSDDFLGFADRSAGHSFTAHSFTASAFGGSWDAGSAGGGSTFTGHTFSAGSSDCHSVCVY